MKNKHEDCITKDWWNTSIVPCGISKYPKQPTNDSPPKKNKYNTTYFKENPLWWDKPHPIELDRTQHINQPKHECRFIIWSRGIPYCPICRKGLGEGEE
jgi:hypothetical protein